MQKHKNKIQYVETAGAKNTPYIENEKNNNIILVVLKNFTKQKCIVFLIYIYIYTKKA